MDSRTREKVDILSGDRGDRGEAAARIKHLQAIIATVPAEPQSTPATAAPTMEQFNLMLDDLRKLYAGLNAMRVLLAR